MENCKLFLPLGSIPLINKDCLCLCCPNPSEIHLSSLLCLNSFVRFFLVCFRILSNIFEFKSGPSCQFCLHFKVLFEFKISFNLILKFPFSNNLNLIYLL